MISCLMRESRGAQPPAPVLSLPKGQGSGGVPQIAHEGGWAGKERPKSMMSTKPDKEKTKWQTQQTRGR